MKNIILFIITTVILIASQMFWKIASGQIGGSSGIINITLKLIKNMWFVSGSIMYILATGLWIYVLSQYEYSKIYPIFVATCLILSLIAGSIFFKENAGMLYKMVGVGFLICGIVIIARS